VGFGLVGNFVSHADGFGQGSGRFLSFGGQKLVASEYKLTFFCFGSPMGGKVGHRLTSQ